MNSLKHCREFYCLFIETSKMFEWIFKLAKDKKKLSRLKYGQIKGISVFDRILQKPTLNQRIFKNFRGQSFINIRLFLKLRNKYTD